MIQPPASPRTRHAALPLPRGFSCEVSLRQPRQPARRTYALQILLRIDGRSAPQVLLLRQFLRQPGLRRRLPRLGRRDYGLLDAGEPMPPLVGRAGANGHPEPLVRPATLSPGRSGPSPNPGEAPGRQADLAGVALGGRHPPPHPKSSRPVGHGPVGAPCLVGPSRTRQSFAGPS